MKFNNITEEQIQELTRDGDYPITHNLDKVIEILSSTSGAIRKTVNTDISEVKLKNDFTSYFKNKYGENYDCYVSRMDIRVATNTLGIKCHNGRYAISSKFLKALSNNFI